MDVNDNFNYKLITRFLCSFRAIEKLLFRCFKEILYSLDQPFIHFQLKVY